MKITQNPQGKWELGSQGNIYDTKEQAEAALAASEGQKRQGSAQDKDDKNAGGMGAKKSFFSKPPKLEACVRHLLADPNFKPKTKGQTKESAAWAVCQGSLNKAMDDIYEAIVILKHFEDDPDDYSLVDPRDYSSYGTYGKGKNDAASDADTDDNVEEGDDDPEKALEVSSDSLTDDGNPIPPELSGLTTSDLTNVPNAPVDVNLNNPQEPGNMLGNPDPSTDTSTDVTNVTQNPMI